MNKKNKSPRNRAEIINQNRRFIERRMNWLSFNKSILYLIGELKDEHDFVIVDELGRYLKTSRRRAWEILVDLTKANYLKVKESFQNSYFGIFDEKKNLN